MALNKARPRMEAVVENHISPVSTQGNKKRKYSASLDYSRPLPPELVNQVIGSLSLPARLVKAAAEWSNDVESSKHIGGVQAYAKLAGSNWTFYVKTLSVTIGREPDVPDDSDFHVNLDLGPAKVVSRNHATIEYDLQERYWQCVVHGRNGLKVDEKTFKEGKIARLSSGNILEIGGVQMMFVLPDAPPQVSPIFTPSHISIPGSSPNTLHAEPASPPPTNASPIYDENEYNALSHAEDLSADSCQDIKPGFSYATMIAQAILSCPSRQMTLSGIYAWISTHYAFYRHAKSGWQNSIRHNLSLNKAFQKVPRRTDEPGKGMKWQIGPEYVEEFLVKTKRPNIRKKEGETTQTPKRQMSVSEAQRDTMMNTPPPLAFPRTPNHPTSSPAPFWKYMVSTLNTPAAPLSSPMRHFSEGPYPPGMPDTIMEGPPLSGGDLATDDGIRDLDGIDLRKGFPEISQWREAEVSGDMFRGGLQHA